MPDHPINLEPNWDNMGMASAIHGMQYAIDVLQVELNNIRLRLAAAQGARITGYIRRARRSWPRSRNRLSSRRRRPVTGPR